MIPDQPLLLWGNDDNTNPSVYKQVLMLTSHPDRKIFQTSLPIADTASVGYQVPGTHREWNLLCLILNAEQTFRVVAQPLVQKPQEQHSEVFIAKIQVPLSCSDDRSTVLARQRTLLESFNLSSSPIFLLQ